MNNHVKIRFTYLEHDGTDSEVESLWAIQAGDGHYEIDNIPFFVRDIALGDIVSASSDDDGALWFEELVRDSGHSTLRVVVFDEANVEPVRNALQNLGCTSEGSHIRKLISVDVPPNVDYESVRSFLEQNERSGWLEYEEACLRS